MTEYIDLRGGYATQREEWHTQQANTNPTQSQPILTHPQPDTSHSQSIIDHPTSTPAYPKSNPSQPTPTPTHTIPSPTNPDPFLTQPIPNPSPHRLTPNTPQPNPSHPQPDPTPHHTTSTPTHPKPSHSHSNSLHTKHIPPSHQPKPIHPNSTHPQPSPLHTQPNPHHPNPNPTHSIPYQSQPTPSQPNPSQSPSHPNPSQSQPNPLYPQTIPTHPQYNPLHSTLNPTQPILTSTHLIPSPLQSIPSPLQPHPHPAQPTPTHNTPIATQLNPHISNPHKQNDTTTTSPPLDVKYAITCRGEEIAKLITYGVKHIENRNFRIGDNTLIAISVGKQAAEIKEVDALHAILRTHDSPVDMYPLTDPMLRGNIIGICRVSHTLTHKECRQSEWADARWKYCNIITEAVCLPTPVPAKGKLGKWLLDKDVQLAIIQQLQDTKLIPTGAAELYPCMKHGTQSTLPYNQRIPQALTQQGTHTHTQTETADIEAAPQHGEARSRTNEQQAERKSRRTLKQHEGEATDDDLKTGKTMMAKESHSSIAAAGHTAAGNNQSTWYNAKEEYRNARRRAWRTYEEGTERHRHAGHTAASMCSSEPHMAAHTTGTAYPVKGVEMHMYVDEDGGRRQRTKRESDKTRWHQALFNHAPA